uniref:VWFA domain-containing protein n=1 Tax=Mucochytrium quahogii TaxID=96639 RepID=A0A7S2RV69_9STRA
MDIDDNQDEDENQEDTSIHATAEALEEDEEDEQDKDENEDDSKEQEEPKPNLPDNSEENKEELDKAFGTDAPKPGENDDDDMEEENPSSTNYSTQKEDEEDEKEKEEKKGDTSGQGEQDDADEQDKSEWVRDESKAGDEQDENKEEADDSQDRMDRQRPNPWKDPGSASEEWHRRLQMISEEEKEEKEHEDVEERDENEQSTEPEDQRPVDEDERKTFEFSDNRDESSTQVLAPSAQDQQDGEDIDKEEEEEEEIDENEGKRKAEEDLDDENEQEEDGDKEMEDDEKTSALQQPKKRRKMDLEKEAEQKDDNKKEESAQTSEQLKEDVLKQELDRKPIIETNLGMLDADVDMGVSQDREHDSMQVEEKHAESLTSDPDYAKWNQLIGDTMESSQRLCEQLRLLLAPTLATKLRGDYRTGKRINMRRVIPYIASQFRKDKIWLRRTKPSKREYQVVIAIDDSKSMAPGGELALNALTTITKAMTKLEVGQVGIISFGEEVKTLHRLEQPFTDACGAEVVSKFTFSQERTSIEEGLSQLIQSFETAKSNLSPSIGGSKTEFRQLAFFVSDGRFDSAVRERVKKMIRDAMAKRLLIVLLIVEHEDEESILSTRQVSFVKGKVKMNAYLDDYPFPLYVILKEMQALPEVLADGLRQWFELLSTSD